MQAKIQQVLIALTNIRGLESNVLFISLFNLLLLYFNRDSNLFIRYHTSSCPIPPSTLESPKQVLMFLFVIHLPPVECQILTFSTADFNSDSLCFVSCSPKGVGSSIFDLLSPSVERLLITDPKSHCHQISTDNCEWLVH